MTIDYLAAQTGRILDVVGRVDPTDSNVVLIYHSIGEVGNQPTPPAVFESHMRVLSERYDLVDLPAVLNGNGDRKIAVTFDDGFVDFYTNALPTIERYEVPVTVFVCADFVGDRDRNRLCDAHSLADPPDRIMLDREQLLNLVDHEYVYVGNHTRSHRDLSTIDDADALHGEIVGNQTALERTLSTTVSRFSFPFHGYNPRAHELVAETHDLGVCGVGLLGDDPDRHSLPRVALPGSSRGIDWSLSGVADTLRKIV